MELERLGERSHRLASVASTSDVFRSRWRWYWNTIVCISYYIRNQPKLFGDYSELANRTNMGGKFYLHR